MKFGHRIQKQPEEAPTQIIFKSKIGVRNVIVLRSQTQCFIKALVILYRKKMCFNIIPRMKLFVIEVSMIRYHAWKPMESK